MITNQYELKEKPSIVHINSTNRVRCHYCNQNPNYYDENQQTKFFKKGDKALELIYNYGPTGKAYICLEHSKQLIKEIIDLFHDNEIGIN